MFCKFLFQLSTTTGPCTFFDHDADFAHSLGSVFQHMAASVVTSLLWAGDFEFSMLVTPSWQNTMFIPMLWKSVVGGRGVVGKYSIYLYV